MHPIAIGIGKNAKNNRKIEAISICFVRYQENQKYEPVYPKGKNISESSKQNKWQEEHDQIYSDSQNF